MRYLDESWKSKRAVKCFCRWCGAVFIGNSHRCPDDHIEDRFMHVGGSPEHVPDEEVHYYSCGGSMTLREGSYSWHSVGDVIFCQVHGHEVILTKSEAYTPRFLP